jgi:hypothetical protein
MNLAAQFNRLLKNSPGEGTAPEESVIFQEII